MRSGKRFVHSDICSDSKTVKVINTFGAMSGLLYVFLLTQTNDEGLIMDTDPQNLKLTIGANISKLDTQDISDILTILNNAELLGWEPENRLIWFPVDAFYKYQNNIPQERRRSEEKIFRHKKLKRAKPRVSSELEEKFDAVWSVVPQEWQTYESEYGIKESLKRYPFFTVYDVKMVMLSIREKFLGKRSDVGFLFANALKWKSENHDTGMTILSYEEFEDTYAKELASAQSIAAKRKEELAHGR